MAQQQNDSKLTDPDSKSASEPATGDSGRNASDKDLGSDMAAPYGTRSRNRAGNPRPNYAEDKDYDVDMYDFEHDKGNHESKKPARQTAAAANGEATRGNGGSRKSLPDDARPSSTQGASTSKDQQTANGTAATQQATGSGTTSQASRKRKAATAAQQANSSTAASTRRGGSGSTSVGQSSGVSWPESNMLTFGNCNARPQNGRLVADDGTVLEANDHVYLVCEPPGEPYYLGRIMEFLHAQNDPERPIDALRINWYYRPRDIGRKVQDTRVVFATMHSDISPLTALRGKCQIRHRVEIENMDEYRKVPDCFWYEKLYDRYIQKNYDLIPTANIVNVPEKVKRVLDERWKYVLVEQGRGKELTSAVKSCKRCSGYCASHDSVDCAVCRNTYHMNCVKPPLLKKPSRGFAWSCAACSRAQERKLEARHTPNVTDPHGDLDEEELLDDEEEDAHGADTGGTSPSGDNEDHEQGTAEQIYHASLWPYRYLGMHCKPEDALDYDDRIYPRASTRIGPRHQAAVNPWPGKPVQYVKPPETKKGSKRGAGLAAYKESQAAQDAEKWPGGKRPKWVQDTPVGYVARGEDYDEDDPNATATCLWKPSPDNDDDEELASLADETKSEVFGMRDRLGLPANSTNLLDVAVELLYRNDYDLDKVLRELPTLDRKIFKEPTLSAVELKRFEEGISKFGSELLLVKKHVKSLTPGDVVRFYYTWKKTDRGRQIWGNFTGRKGKKEAKRAEAAASKRADDVADDEDDSAFDSNKAVEKKRAFICHFCSATASRRWRRAPNATAGFNAENAPKSSKDSGAEIVVALCTRCAELWRRYAIRWEDIDEMSKKVAQAGGKAWKRKQDEELLKELQAAKNLGIESPERATTPLNGAGAAEPPRKKLKGAPEKEVDSDGGSSFGAAQAKKKDKASEASAVPEMPKPRTLPCAICNQLEPLGDQHVSCRECRLSVHRQCYGIMDHRGQGKWTCDMCINDKNPQVSIDYKCVLCPVKHTEHDFVDQPKLTHHKKKMSDKDREREKVEVQQARKAAEFYRKRQEELNRPVNPREPLKRTADNNWVHVTCAVWTGEVKFGNAKAMEPSEGIPSIPRHRYEETCLACGKGGGACVPCQHCRYFYHIECARKAGHTLGFEVTAVKSNRRDQFNIVTLKGDHGTMTASVWCKDHEPTKTAVHRMEDEADDTGLTVLQFFVQNFKQADLALTGTVRKANLMTTAAKTSGTGPPTTGRRASTTTPAANISPPHRNGGLTGAASDAYQPGAKICASCGIDVSPKWWAIDNSQERELTNGHYGAIGSEAQKFVEQRKFQCHKCRKLLRTPKPQPSPAPAKSDREEPSRPGPTETLPPVASHYHQRSPQAGLMEHRDGGRSMHTGWPQPQPSHPSAPTVHASHHPQPQSQSQSQPPPQPQPQPHLPSPRHSTLPHGSPPPPTVSSAIPSATPQPPPMQHPHRTAYAEWGPRPGSQHGSPPRRLNGIIAPPPPPPPSTSILNGPPPAMSNLSSLRPPPAMTGAPPPGSIHGHPHGPQSYINGMPPSPRRNSNSVLAQPYPPPNYGHGGPPPPPPAPAHVGHGLSNGGPPPPRPDPYQHRTPYYAGPHDPHYGSRHSLPPSHEQPPGPPSIPPRNPPEHRPASGASASPSLRNLLS